MKINTEFRKGVMFIRIKGCLCEKNLDNIKYEDFKYIVFNFDNLLSIYPLIESVTSIFWPLIIYFKIPSPLYNYIKLFT